MWEHCAVATVITWIMCQILDWTPNSWIITLGAVFGGLPDLISLLFTKAGLHGRESYKHRNNISHSLWLVPIITGTIGCFDIWMGIIAGLSVMAHLIMDTWGIGWGAMLFWPHWKEYIKIDLEPGRWHFNQREIDRWVNASGSENLLWEMFMVFGYTQTIELFSMMVIMYMITWPYQ